MKQCPRCQTDYDDDQLNFCLNDGEMLTAFGRQPTRYADEPPPTLYLDQSRVTNPAGWPAQPPTSPIGQWQPQNVQNEPFGSWQYRNGFGHLKPCDGLLLRRALAGVAGGHSWVYRNEKCRQRPAELRRTRDGDCRSGDGYYYVDIIDYSYSADYFFCNCGMIL
jgi:hypothetical protein